MGGDFDYSYVLFRVDKRFCSSRTAFDSAGVAFDSILPAFDSVGVAFDFILPAFDSVGTTFDAIADAVCDGGMGLKNYKQFVRKRLILVTG